MEDKLSRGIEKSLKNCQWGIFAMSRCKFLCPGDQSYACPGVKHISRGWKSKCTGANHWKNNISSIPQERFFSERAHSQKAVITFKTKAQTIIMSNDVQLSWQQCFENEADAFMHLESRRVYYRKISGFMISPSLQAWKLVLKFQNIIFVTAMALEFFFTQTVIFDDIFSADDDV